MPRIQANGIDIEYETYGPQDGQPLLLVSGFTSQMIRWPDSLLEGFAQAGRRVIVFDNRDIGLTTEMVGHSVPSPKEIAHAIAGGCPPRHLVPYLLDDMAADAVALLDGLGIDKADVMGFSMGGMIVQLIALNHPERVRKLIPVMTTSGDPSLPPGDKEAMAALTAVPKSRSPEDIAEVAIVSAAAIGSHPDIRPTADEVRARSMRDTARSDRPMGVARQYAAILAQPRWHERLGEISQPALVLHGAVDPLIRPAAGQDIARRIPGARYVDIPDWGHDIPEAVVPRIVEIVNGFLDEA
ncbi:MAG: alpha/beta hydrolase [Hyphomonas sp.]|nr:alpha/beta hydrolase [Hyphomonas sp.]